MFLPSMRSSRFLSFILLFLIINIGRLKRNRNLSQEYRGVTTYWPIFCCKVWLYRLNAPEVNSVVYLHGRKRPSYFSRDDCRTISLLQEKFLFFIGSFSLVSVVTSFCIDQAANRSSWLEFNQFFMIAELLSLNSAEILKM